MTDSRLYAELVQVERAALRRGPRMRGLGDAARVGDYATPAQWHSANSWLDPCRIGGCAGAAVVVYITALADRRVSWRAELAQDGSLSGEGSFSLDAGQTLTKPTIGFHPRVPGSNSPGTAPVPGPASPTLTDADIEASLPWTRRTSLTGGMIGNGWAIAIGVGVLALGVGGGVWYARRTR